MQNWKKIVAVGTLGAGAALVISGRRSLGLASVAGGLALLASEYPEHFESFLESAPDYIHRASEIFTTLSRMSAHFAEEAERRTIASFGHFQTETE